jgi:hypothetical protein
MGILKVSEFLKCVWDSYEARLAEHNTAKSLCVQKLTELASAKNQVQRIIEEKELLRKQAVGSGLDVSPLDQEIQSLRANLNDVHNDYAVLAEQSATGAPSQPYDWNRMQRLIQHLIDRGIDEVVVLASVDDVSMFVQIDASDVQVDEIGRVVKATARIGGYEIGSVKLNPEVVRFAKSFRPEGLNWVPFTASRLLKNPSGY